MKRRVPGFIIALTLCLNLCPVWAFAADGGTDGGLCPHHMAHTDECGYVQESPDALCTFACQICPVEDLTGKLPGRDSEDNRGQVQAQLSEIYALYDGPTADEQRQADLSPCGSPQDQLGGMDLAVLSDDPGNSSPPYVLTEDFEYPAPFKVPSSMEFNTNGHTFTGTGTGSAAIQVSGTGRLYLTGTVVSPNGIGVEVLSGGFLSITEPETSITGYTYALDIASGAKVHLSTGRYSGRTTAIRTADGNLAALLEPGYAYFDISGEPLLPADAAETKILDVGRCPDHLGRIYAHSSGATTHTWTCPYCGMKETETCTLTFNQDGNGTCNSCENTITIAVDQDSLKALAYDETVKPTGGSVTVTVDGTVELTLDTDYTVAYTTRAEVGSSDVTVTVTVDGSAYHGSFTKSYTFTKAELERPVLEWANAAATVTYTGKPVETSGLPKVTININPNTGLDQYLRYSYRKQGETAYSSGLPTNAGTYDVVVSLPEMEGAYAVSSEPITLTVNKLNPISKVPAAKTLTYSGKPQELVTKGELHSAAADDGAVILYATSKTGEYSTEIPTGIIASSNHKAWYKVEATDNCNKVDPTEIPIRISSKSITPTVELEYYTTLYTGGDKEPKVTVKDGEYEIPTGEYTVTYTNNRNVGTAKVTVTNKSNGNYTIKNPGVTVEFKITSKTQDALSITQKPNTVAYGDEFTLSTLGGSGNGNVTWAVVSGSATVNSASGQVKITGDGNITIKATKSGTDPVTKAKNYEDATDTWTFTAAQRPVTATVTAEDKFYGETYGGSDRKAARVRAEVEQGVLPGDKITITGLTGTFSDENVGADKTVTVNKNSASISGTNSQYYAVTYSSLSVKAAINKVAANIAEPPGAANPTYNGTDQPLVTNGRTAGNIGTIVYSTSQDGVYLTDIPTGAGAGKYTVWYKVEDSVNYTGTPAAEVKVEIKKADPKITINSPAAGTEGQLLSEISLEGVVSADVGGTFDWASSDIPAVNGTEYDVIFEPGDKHNYNTVIVQVQVTITEPPETEPPETEPPETEPPEVEQPEVAQPGPGGDITNSTSASRPGTSSAATNTSSTPTQTITTVKNGTASTVMSAADGSRLVQEASANQSRNVVIKPEITGNVTKAEVSIPSSTLRRLGSETDAALTVSSPVADVTIPNEALDTLSQAGGAVSVVTEQTDQSVVLTVAAGGETVEQVPGGVTLTVPVEDAGPGTVAVLVNDDGTRETVRKSVVGDGAMSIPLSGSATVEIVDNSKDFADVPSESWAADAVDFASAHELFSGTSETTFSPDMAMSRGMLATVLYRLEGNPELDPTDAFLDVDNDAWYAEGVAWAAENGIAGGYGGGQFGPDDSITREQFVVMLWRYAGSPEAGSQVLDFVDADQVSSFALEALCWAVENGILHGVGNGVLDPGGTATRAQAAQLLKNFMESTR